MTARERRLRERIDQLLDRLWVVEVTERRINPANGKRYRRCVYCGSQVGSASVACKEHRDLLALDPHYQLGV